MTTDPAESRRSRLTPSSGVFLFFLGLIFTFLAIQLTGYAYPTFYFAAVGAFAPPVLNSVLRAVRRRPLPVFGQLALVAAVVSGCAGVGLLSTHINAVAFTQEA